MSRSWLCALPVATFLVGAASAQQAVEIDFSAVLTDLKDQPIFETDRAGKPTEEKLTLGSVSASVMMSVTDAERNAQPKDIFANQQLGFRLQHAGVVKLTTASDCKKDPSCLTVADRDKLKDRIMKVWGGIVAYRAWGLLDPESKD